MIKYLQLPFHFNVQSLRDELTQLLETSWQLHYQKLHYEGEWSALPLRSIDGVSDNIIVSPVENPIYKDTVFLNACPYYKEVLSSFKCTLLSVRLLKLSAGAVIKEHRDAELNFEKGEIRLHIPVSTHNDVEFMLDGERMHLQQGECWYMNFNLKHSVANKSTIDRIHLVIDAKVNQWVENLFLNQALCKKEIEEPSYDISVRKEIIAILREMNTETGRRLADEMQARIEIDSVQLYLN